MAETSIEWATHVYNPFTGCDRVSAGCASCYALDYAPRLKAQERGRAAKALAVGRPAPTMRYQLDGDPRTSGAGFGFAVHWDKLLDPPRFPAGARVFVNSMSDVFHADAPVEAIAALWRVFLTRPDVDWLVLTKRSDRMRNVLNNASWWWDEVGGMAVDLAGPPDRWHRRDVLPAPPNVWLGATVENRAFISRADDLRATPAAVRFVSAEPLLGPLVNLDRHWKCEACGHRGTWHGGYNSSWCCADGCQCSNFLPLPAPPDLDLSGIDWLIVGGESNGRAGRRLVDERNEPIPERLGWVRDLRDACLAARHVCDCWGPVLDSGHCSSCGLLQSARTAFFFKQWGGRTPKAGGRELDGRTWDEMPAARTGAVPA